MRKKILVQSLALTSLVLATIAMNSSGLHAEVACNIYRATLMEPGEKTGEVSTAELRKIVAEHGAIILDTRDKPQFEAGHIPGAYSLDSNSDDAVSAANQILNGDKSRALVLYCNGPYCKASRRMADKLVGAGFSDVRRYQLGIPVWRALGGPTVIEEGGVARVYKHDKTAVFIDARSADEFNAGSLNGAVNAPIDLVASGKIKKIPLPEDDFNRRVILFGRDASQAALFAEILSERPWHNVSYFPGTFDELSKLVTGN